MRHNVDKALPGKNYQYIAWDASGNLFNVYRPLSSDRVWVARKDRGNGTVTADTLTQLADKLSAQCFI